MLYQITLKSSVMHAETAKIIFRNFAPIREECVRKIIFAVEATHKVAEIRVRWYYFPKIDRKLENTISSAFSVALGVMETISIDCPTFPALSLEITRRW